MDPLSWLYLAIILVLVALSGFFSSTETSFACLNQFKLRVEADNGNKKAKLILKTYERFEKVLTVSLLGYNISSIAISTLSAFLFYEILKNSGLTTTAVSLISSVVMAVIVYLFSDLIPKMIAKAMPNAVARNNIYIARFFMFLFYPLVLLLHALTRLVNKLFKTGEQMVMTEEDFTNVVDELEEQDVLNDDESDLIYASLDFTDTSVKEVFTHRNKIAYLDIKNLSQEDIKNKILSIPFSRIPVCYGSLDKIVGVLHVKSYIKAYLKNPNIQLMDVVQQPYFVTPRIKMDEMLEGFKKHHTHIAIVRHEGHVIGLITMEDVLEELVGKIAEPRTQAEGEKK